MKLYELPRGAYFHIIGNEPVQMYQFMRVDGMYSVCYDSNKNLIHIAAYADVETVEEEYETY